MYIHIIICVYIYMIIIYTWILLIVEISTPKPKSINFAKFKRKRTPERLFPLQNAFFNSRTLPNGFERFLNAFWTLFSTPERPKCQERQKPLWCSFFHTNPQNRSFLGLELKNPVLGSFILIYVSIPWRPLTSNIEHWRLNTKKWQNDALLGQATRAWFQASLVVFDIPTQCYCW